MPGRRPPARPVDILLVEDNLGDVRLIREALTDSRFPNEVHVARDGVESLAYLRREAPHDRASRPALIVLDLNMPRMDGREVLSEIKSDPKLRQIPIVVMTSSAAAEDIIAAYDRHANCYIRKPVNFEQFLAAVQKIEDFWFNVVELPPAR